jgi:hypothetical protein
MHLAQQSRRADISPVFGKRSWACMDAGLVALKSSPEVALRSHRLQDLTTLKICRSKKYHRDRLLSPTHLDRGMLEVVYGRIPFREAVQQGVVEA